MTDMITAGRTEIFASPPGTEHNTFTIIGRCERTGMLGICTTTRSLSVGSRVTHGRARVGVIAFQPARVQSRDRPAVRLARRAAGPGERGAVAGQDCPRRRVIVTKAISAASPMSRSPVPVR